MDEQRINLAARDCLRQCYGSSDVLPRVAEFLTGLKVAGGWSVDEIHTVELTVHKVLHGIVTDPVYPGDATDQPHGDVGRGGSETTKTNGV